MNVTNSLIGFMFLLKLLNMYNHLWFYITATRIQYIHSYALAMWSIPYILV